MIIPDVKTTIENLINGLSLDIYVIYDALEEYYYDGGGMPVNNTEAASRFNMTWVGCSSYTERVMLELYVERLRSIRNSVEDRDFRSRLIFVPINLENIPDFSGAIPWDEVFVYE